MTDAFHVARSLRLPGLGVLVLPTLPAPPWLSGPALHAALALRLHRRGQPAQPVVATVEEVGTEAYLPTRALLLDDDPGGEVGPGAWLEPRPDEEVAFI